jgi:hypothetical protein
VRAEGQPDQRERRRDGRAAERRALPLGILASILLHLLILVLNPSFKFDLLPMRAPPAAGDPEMGRLIQLSTRESAVGAVAAEAAAPPATTPATGQRPRPAPGGVRGAPPADAGAPGATPGERLRYRPGPIWTPMQQRPMTLEECRRLQLAQRLERGIADETFGVAPPPAGIEPVQNRGIGVRIPFGTRRPPPAQVVPAPLPDSLRGASHRPETRRPPPDTGRVFFAQDCLSDTTLRMPRVRPDTTGRS